VLSKIKKLHHEQIVEEELGLWEFHEVSCPLRIAVELGLCVLALGWLYAKLQS